MKGEGERSESKKRKRGPKKKRKGNKDSADYLRVMEGRKKKEGVGVSLEIPWFYHFWVGLCMM